MIDNASKQDVIDDLQRQLVRYQQQEKHNKTNYDALDDQNNDLRDLLAKVSI